MRRRRFLDRLGRLGVAQTLFSSLVQDYVRAHGWGWTPGRPDDRAGRRRRARRGQYLRGDARRLEAGLRNCWWIIDYNRQSLDAVIREGLWSRYEALFRAFGWDVVILNTVRFSKRPLRSPAAICCGNGSTSAQTSFIPRSSSRAARRGASTFSPTLDRRRPLRNWSRDVLTKNCPG
jgi:hypothetical protein